MIFPDEDGENPGITLRRFQVGDLVRFRAQSRVPDSYDIGSEELGTVVWVEPHPPETGPTYKIEAQFERARMPRIFRFEYELMKAVTPALIAPVERPVVTPYVSRDDVEAFCSFCVSLRSTYRHFQILFEEGGDLRRQLIQDTAPVLFGDLNRMLIEHLILQICKITDPEESFGRKNLTVKFLINNSNFSNAAGELPKLRQLADSIGAFRDKIVIARNKLIGHLDRVSVLDGSPLGGADKDSWGKFWLDLQEFTQVLHKQYIDSHGHFYLNGVGQLSDADSLVKAIKESTYFHNLLNDKKLTQKCADIAFGSQYSEA